MVPLEAIRKGDTLVLAGREAGGSSHAPWIDLVDGWEGLPASVLDRGTMVWDPEAPREGLAPLSLFESTEYLARVAPATVWDPHLSHAITAVNPALGGRGLYVLAFRGRAGRAWLGATGEGGQTIFGIDVEVRTRKVDYLTGYRAMLDALGEVRWGEALTLDGGLTAVPLDFSRLPSAGAWDAFLRLRYLARGGALTHAVAMIRRDPVVHLRALRRVVPTSRASRVRPDDLASRMGPPGPGGLPSTVAETAPMSTLDTPENRFVVSALGGLQHLALSLARGDVEGPLRSAAESLAGEFGQLHEGLFGPGVEALPPGSSIPTEALQRRRGYREVLSAWRLATDEALAARWDGRSTLHEDVRDTATLYERWCALEIGRAAGVAPHDLAALLAGQPVAGEVEGVRLTLRSQARPGESGRSYSLAFRPDLTVDAAGRRLLFDAKYQLERSADVVGQGEDLKAAHPRSGIVKMHAYRDAIAGTWGAYVVYPGHEPDPALYVPAGPDGGGVGALPLRPGAGPAVRDRQRAALGARLRSFVTAVRSRRSGG